jgi:hypothetical protein
MNICKKCASRLSNPQALLCPMCQESDNEIKALHATLTNLRRQILADAKWMKKLQGNPTAWAYDQMCKAYERKCIEVAELEGKLRNIRNASLPDPYDERDIALSWLLKVIEENTK